MKLKTAQMFAEYQELSSFDVVVPPDPKYVPDESELSRIISEIFTLDPETNLPMGDLAYYLSSDGNPMVKEWLMNNLLRPRVTEDKSLDGVTDDMIEEFSRRHGETFTSYANRLGELYVSAKEEYEKSLLPENQNQ